MSFLSNFLTAVGTLYLTKLSTSFILQLYASFIRAPLNLSKYKSSSSGTTSWAVVTGAGDGIGKEFALQLAKAGFSIILISRTVSKLEAVATEINSKFKVQTEVIGFDFAGAKDSDYASLTKKLEKFSGGITILINNVGVSHDFPTPFLVETQTKIDSIINVNIVAALKISRIVVPWLVEKKKGLVLNLGSFAGVAPSPLLSVYSGSKTFLNYWSQSFASELEGTGVHVELLNTFFVATAMSKIRKPTVFAPTPKTYVKAALERSGSAAYSTPYWAHALLTWAVDEFVPGWVLTKQELGMHKDLRRRALKKLEREAKKE